MNLQGKKITVHDMTLRDGMHPKRHLMTLDQKALKTIIDEDAEYVADSFPALHSNKNKGIFDDLNDSAKTIQRAFRKSRGYAEWAYHPDRLNLHGYFDI